MAMEEKELFEDYEVRNWDITPRVYKILGISALMNLFVFFAFGQFNLLNTRACDNALMNPLCQVMDAVYVGTVLSGRETEWASRPYEKTELEDAEITFIDVSDQLQYPEGYFALANPPSETDNPLSSDFANLPSTDSTTPAVVDDLIGKPAVVPTPNTSVGNQDVPESPFSIGDKPFTPSKPQTAKNNKKPAKTPKLPNDSPGLPSDKDLAGNGKEPKADPTPEPSPVDTQAEFNEKFNKKPLQDYADSVVAKTDATTGKVDLKSAFTVVMDGVLLKDGKLDGKRSKFVTREGSEEMIDVAKGAIEAVNNSGLLGYLKDLGAEKVNFSLVQDDKAISVVIRSDQVSPEKAKQIASGLGVLIGIAKGNVKEPEVQMLLNSAKLKADGKSFVMNFAIPKEEAHKIIEQKLQEARQKKSQTNNGDGDKETGTAKGE